MAQVMTPWRQFRQLLKLLREPARHVSSCFSRPAHPPDLPSERAHVCAADSHSAVAQPLLGLFVTWAFVVDHAPPPAVHRPALTTSCMCAGTAATVPGVA